MKENHPRSIYENFTSHCRQYYFSDRDSADRLGQCRFGFDQYLDFRAAELQRSELWPVGADHLLYLFVYHLADGSFDLRDRKCLQRADAGDDPELDRKKSGHAGVYSGQLSYLSQRFCHHGRGDRDLSIVRFGLWSHRWYHERHHRQDAIVA